MGYSAIDGADLIEVDEGAEGYADFRKLGSLREQSSIFTSQGTFQSLGLVDLQINGFAGVDMNSGNLDCGDIEKAMNAILATGVTTCLPTIISATPDKLLARFESLDRALSSSLLGNKMAPGYHLEGPFLSPVEGYAGMHPQEAMMPADYNLVETLESKLDRPILLITVAAEQKGAPEFIKEASLNGKIVAIGHSQATEDALDAAIDAGAVMSTHLGNGLPQLLPRLDNALWRQLGDDRLMASFIPDGFHIPEKTLRCLIRAKQLERTILVTDAATPAGAPAGVYEFAGIPIEAKPNGLVCRPGEPGLAGSSLKLDDGIRNLVNWGIATPTEAIRMACANPNQLLFKAMDAHGIKPMATCVEWSANLYPTSAKVGDYRISLQ
ncbi:N-acetylglucosamine-6-phosphate deacetylase [Pseudovibrio exalbescens]|uniref:N-acetylglucosamine-6-phosphate deacetylase n=1 Tax=Pseudovibrio exalbescens TaxID=197461 RepID=UPI001AD92F07|nr:N-acetylglucosamine-6-phosphate deacetylase [Pseudovibrio exalbescens]